MTRFLITSDFRPLTLDFRLTSMFSFATLVVIFFILGTIVGSFLNVVILRTYRGKCFLMDRSCCPRCEKIIGWYDNIPLISFIILNGKCRSCKSKISWSYPIVEMITGLLFVFSGIWNIGITPGATEFNLLQLNLQTLILNNQILLGVLRDWIIIAFLVVIFVQDLKWYVILDKIILPATAVVFLLNLFLGKSFLNLILAMAIASGFFYLQFIFSRGRWIGGGDIRMGAFMGAALGYPQILVALFLAYILGSIIAIFLLLLGKKKMSSKLPFGAFLAPATLITLFWGEALLNWYLNLLSL